MSTQAAEVLATCEIVSVIVMPLYRTNDVLITATLSCFYPIVSNDIPRFTATLRPVFVLTTARPAYVACIILSSRDIRASERGLQLPPLPPRQFNTFVQSETNLLSHHEDVIVHKIYTELVARMPAFIAAMWPSP